MTITVKVIFWGLFALTPAKEPGEVTALFANISADAPRALAHTAQVWLLNGTCDHSSACFRGIDELVKRSKPPFNLIWFPGKEEIRIGESASTAHLAHGARRNFLGRPERFPGNLDESGDSSWIPEMDRITSSHRTLKDDCLTTAVQCPISARFIIDKGEVSSCHLMHKEYDQVEAFDFKAQAGSAVIDFNQATADAAADEFEVEGTSITLSAWSFDQQEVASATLSPDADGKIVLLVGNFPLSEAASQMKHLESHFGLFYELLADPPAKKPVRHKTLVFHRAEPGSCEPDLINFETGVIDFESRLKPLSDPRLLAFQPRHPPHISTECDIVQLGAPKQ